MFYFLIGIAGMIGSLLRYGWSLMIDFQGDAFPFSTFSANIVGSFVLGWFTTRIQKVNKLPPHFPTAIGTGLIGSFTTFSTFSLETVRLMRASHPWIAFIYVVLSLIIGLAAAWAGYRIGDHARRTKTKGESGS